MFDPMRRILAALETHRVRYAVFGAMAMALHGLPRFTEDLDIFVEPEAANIGRLRAALESVYEDRRSPRSPPRICSVTTRPFSTFRLPATSTSTS